MTQALALLGLTSAAVVACVGWGRLVLAAAGRLGPGSSLPDVPAGLAGVLGLALTLLAPGPLVLAGVFHVALAVPWAAVGAGAAIVHARRAAHRPRPAACVLLAGALAAAAGWLLLQATRLAPVNFCDNEAAYLPLAARLAETGGLVEPFSQRRLGTYGGLTALQAVTHGLLGPEAAYVPDVLVGGTLAVLLLLPVRARAGRIAIGAALAGCLLLWQSGRNNLSPTSIVLALLAGGALLLVELRRAGVPVVDRRAVLLLALVAGGLLTLRVNHAVPWLLTAGLVLAAARAPRRRRAAAVGLLGAATAAAVLPWALALWRSSGTPLFPLVPGNADPAWPGLRDPGTTSVADHLHELLALASVPGIAALVAGAAVALAAARAVDPGARGTLLGPAVLVPAACAGAAAVVLTTTAFLPVDHARLTWPVLASGLLAALAVLADAAERAGGPRRAVGAGVALVVAAAVAVPGLPRTGDAVGAARAVAAGEPLLATPWAAAEAEYRAAQRSLPRGARILSATDFPHLLDLERNDAVSLDIVGHVSPPPGLPVFAPAAEQAEQLRRQGIDAVIATDPAVSACLWSRRTWTSGAALDQPYVRWAPYFLAWFGTVEGLEARAPGRTRRFGSLIVHRLHAGE